MRITALQIEAAYEIAGKVFNKSITMDAGATVLQDAHGLNINSARDFINDYRLMIQGKVFHRAMSAPAIDYFLMKIVDDIGEPALKAAVSSVEKHIVYYEGIRKVSLHAMRKVVSHHKSRLISPPLLREQEAVFNAKVKKALADAPAKRQARLEGAAKMPVKVKVITEAYVRNADVVAEVLHRASGSCERCKARAPFMRKKDGTPFLEVHHKKQLASGGEDTIDNAIALCPNCHRELHFGI